MQKIFQLWRQFQLCENSVNDANFRDEALSVFNAIRQYLNMKKNVKNYGLISHKDSNGFIITPQMVKEIPSDMIIVLKPLGTNSGLGQTKEADKRWALTLALLPGRNDSTNLNLQFNKKKSAFVHEFIHYLDVGRHKGPNIENTAELWKQKKFKEYFNSDFEVNAYFQKAAQDIITILEPIAKLRPELVKTYFKNFEIFLKFAIEKTHKRFLSFLTDSNKKKYVKRMYSLYKYLKSNYGIK